MSHHRQDISDILTTWSYDEEEGMQVRLIPGDDGVPRLQVRLDLGLLQMELSGRPDGKRPYGFPSLLHYYRYVTEEHRSRHGWYEGFELDGTECAALRQEMMQYYHRRIALMALQDFTRSVEDADHNLEILDLLKAFAGDPDDWLASEQYRAFISSQRVQALTLGHLMREDVEAALLEIERGVAHLKEVFAEQGRLDEFEESSELAALEDLNRKLEARYQVNHRRRLQILLDDALRREDPDAAAHPRAYSLKVSTGAVR